jgi:anthranilate synthase/phosphoribosyltransferase
MMRKIFVVDNYDSFVYNVVHYLGKGEDVDVIVKRNDEVRVSDIERIKPDCIVLSPGPGRPEKVEILQEIIKKFYKDVPIIGVCLGHQAIGYTFSAKIDYANKVQHGKVSYIKHIGKGIFFGLKNPLKVVRYHSLVVSDEGLSDEMLVIARTIDDGTIMAIEHKEYKLYGVQFHPESILTENGIRILKNFLQIAFSSSMKTYVPLGVDEMKEREIFSVKGVLNRLLRYEDLSYEMAYELMKAILSGELSYPHISALLIALRMKGESGDEIGAFSNAMYDYAVRLRTFSDKTVDTCGTGGDGASTYNISTLTAILVSAGGVSVAKHGNRSISSKVGSADVLEALGYKLVKTKEENERELRDVGFTFLFAPSYHPAMKNVMPVRKELGVRTVFNILGPLVNPAGVKYQLLGVYDANLMEKMAIALSKMKKKAVVVNGGFTDELTTASYENKALLVDGDDIKEIVVDIKALGLSKGDISDLQGGEDKEQGATIIKNILLGKENKTKIETAILNAGVVFWLVGDVSDIKDGVEKASDIITSKKGYDKLNEIIEYNKQFEER